MLEEIARYQFSCTSQKLLVLKRHFSAYKNGVQIGKGDDAIRMLADTVFEEGKNNLLTTLTATCKLWESNQQIKNNANFHSFLLNSHSVILNRMLTKKRYFIPSLMVLIGPDYFFEYHEEKKSKTEAYNLLGLATCDVSTECWKNYDTRVAMNVMSICMEEHEMPIAFQSDYCKETKYSIE